MKIRKFSVALIFSLLLIFLISPKTYIFSDAEKKAEKKYPFLSDLYNSPHFLTVADWQALQMAIKYSHSGLTDKLLIETMDVILTDRLLVIVDTYIQPGWKVNFSKGKFIVSDKEIKAAYTEASEEVLKIIRIVFPGDTSGLSDKDIRIIFSIRLHSVGLYEKGKFKMIK